jgi:hypothetical protein
MLTTNDILNDLDTNCIYEYFLDLEHGYFYTSGSRINLYGDKRRWAIVFEKSGFGNRSGQAEIVLNYFGNCLVNPTKAGLDEQFISNTNYITLIDDEFERIAEGFELVSLDAKTINIRGKEIPIEQDFKKYRERGILTQDFDNPNNQIDFPSLVRYLDEDYPELFRATNEELGVFLPLDLPFIMSIDKWFHTRIKEYGGPNPSENETFQLIAEILVSGDRAKWKPKIEANNDWRNWPKAGGL